MAIERQFGRKFPSGPGAAWPSSSEAQAPAVAVTELAEVNDQQATIAMLQDKLAALLAAAAASQTTLSENVPAVDTPIPVNQPELEMPERRTISIALPSLQVPWATIAVFVLGSIVVWNLFGESIKDWFNKDDSADVTPVDPIKPDPIKPDDPEVVPIAATHAQAAALNLYKMYAADWQGKLEIMKAASKQTFESDSQRADWINKEFAERFSLAADPFLEELSNVMAENKEADMAAIMAGAQLDFDIKSAAKKIDAAAKRIKK